MQRVLGQAIKTALESAGIIDTTCVVERPLNLSHGDYATNAALAAAKVAGKNPRELAETLVVALREQNIPNVERIEIAGAGFINFHFSRDYFKNQVAEIVSAGALWGKGNHYNGKRVMYEYTDPNPFKVFHIGHLMSNAIGEALASIGEWNGADVVRANYQGDIGPHVAKAVWAMRTHKNEMPNEDGSLSEKTAFLGKMYVVGDTAYEGDETQKAEIEAINKELYSGSTGEVQALYDTGRRWSLEHFEELYALLGTRFDHYFFESEMGPIGLDVVKEGLAKGVFEESDGAIVYKGEKVGLHTRVFITRAGTPTYETKELGLDKTKFEKEKLDHSVIVTANEQDGFFQVVLAAMREVLPHVAERTEHISHGMMQLEGGKMSSRKGNVITGESLIEEMRERALLKMGERDLEAEKQEVADAVAIAAIKYAILKQGMGKNIVFDPEQSLSFEGDSGPYLQYAHARSSAVLRKSDDSHISASIENAPENPYELERVLGYFPSVVERACIEREPHHIVTYLTELAGLFNSFYATERITDATDGFGSYRVALTQAVKITLHNGLSMLGIKALERM